MSTFYDQRRLVTPPPLLALRSPDNRLRVVVRVRVDRLVQRPELGEGRLDVRRRDAVDAAARKPADRAPQREGGHAHAVAADVRGAALREELLEAAQEHGHAPVARDERLPPRDL